MSVDEDEESIDREVYEPKEDVRCMLQSCRFTMKMKMIEAPGSRVISHSP